MARVTVELNDRLLDNASSLFKGKTRDELITIALVELVDKYEQKNLYDLFYDDEILIAEGYDYIALRSGSIRDSSKSDSGDSSDAGVDILDDGGVYYEKSGDAVVDSGAGFGGSDAGFGGSDAGFGGSDVGFGGGDLSSDFGDDLTGNTDDFSYSEDNFENGADSFTESGGSSNDFS